MSKSHVQKQAHKWEKLPENLRPADCFIAFAKSNPEFANEAFYPMFPFQQGQVDARDLMVNTKQPNVSSRIPLPERELKLIYEVVGSYKLSHIKAFLTQQCNAHDPTNLRWDNVIAHLEVYLNKQGSRGAVGKTSQPKKRGARKKYTVSQLKEVLASCDKYYKKLKDKKGAWNKAAKDHKIESGKAAEMACRRYLKQNK
jgi:hypothetical protein